LIGDSGTVLEAFDFIKERSVEIGLEVNEPKCEIWWPHRDPEWCHLLREFNLEMTFSGGTEIWVAV
jgi:hypothetical protein